MKLLIFILMGAVSIVLINLKPIVAEYSLRTPSKTSVTEQQWVDDFRSEPDIAIPSGQYRFLRTYTNGETMDATFLIDSDAQRVTIEGEITVGDFVKRIHSTAYYSIDGSVIDYRDREGHVQLFPTEGHVAAFTDDNKLVLKSRFVTLTAF
ncbi:MAG TPA: hypothetical protein DCR58_02105 [Idiomarina baltica]|uniref:Uncharacterized protein n=2 Tax=Alteromonadales TaxID=135622 RepID=A0A358DYK4_9ALTE|nr:hypothetical protein [Alteromonas australica]HAR55560.1 hypothetical protein [Idiomarina baltica]HBU51336.1 hypothetical protein [Alteromonas australica]|tara:strand:- start:5128 stop:5580 length:453 start_codon:yes stop_codon:yes gene_type:complete